MEGVNIGRVSVEIPEGKSVAKTIDGRNPVWRKVAAREKQIGGKKKKKKLEGRKRKGIWRKEQFYEYVWAELQVVKQKDDTDQMMRQKAPNEIAPRDVIRVFCDVFRVFFPRKS